MLKTVGFIPVIEGLVSEMGNVYPAYIYGYIWLHRSDSHFDQPLDNMPERLGISRSTVRKWVPWLCENGYLVDETPDLDNQPHRYLLTDKASLDWSVEVHIAPSKFRRLTVRDTDGVPSEIRTPHGRPRYGPHDHDMMHDHDYDLQTAITDFWRAIGFDLRGLPKMLKTWEGHEGGLRVCLESWLEALNNDAIPDTWGAGLVYKKIAEGEMPPEKPRTIGDEVLELMELTKGGEIE